MLVIKVELWPDGEESRAKEIGRLGAANVSDLASLSDYVFAARTDRGEEATGAVTGHRRADGFWALIARLADAAARRNTVVPAKHAREVQYIREDLP